MTPDEFIRSLVGRELHTVKGRPNTILRIEADTLIVATERSPSGKPVPLLWVRDAIERLERLDELEISVDAVGHRSALIGAVVRELPGAIVLPTSPPTIRVMRR
jgi:hypothetical protein